MKKPNLFIIGAMKSGTTSLHHYLSKHKNIFMSEPKEPGYFKTTESVKKETDWYYSLFNKANHSHIYIGEGSTDYSKLPQYVGVADRIKLASPNAKIIYVMRNPFKRTISHYWHTVRPQRSDGQTKNFYDAVQSFEGYLSFSDYPRQIAPYINSFGIENIHFVIFEELIENPKKELKKIFNFLEIDTNYDWSELKHKLNARPGRIMGVKKFSFVHKFTYSTTWNFLSPFVPKRLKMRIKSKVINEIEPNREEKNIQRILLENKKFYTEIIIKTGHLLNRDLNKIWKL